MLVFTGQYDGDQEFVDGPLDRDDGDNAQYRMRGIPELKEPEELKGCDEANQAQGMCESSHNRSELGPRLHHRAQEQRDEEQPHENRGIPHYRSNCDDRNTDERTWGEIAVLIREGFDEHICDDKDGGHANGPDDL